MLVNTTHISKTLDASIYYYYRLRVIVVVSTAWYAHIAVYYKEEHNKHFQYTVDAVLLACVITESTIYSDCVAVNVAIRSVVAV